MTSALSAKILLPQSVSNICASASASIVNDLPRSLSPASSLSGTSPPKLTAISPTTPVVATKPKWSRQMSFQVPMYRAALEATKTSVRYSRSLLSLIPTSVPDSIQVNHVKLPRRSDILLDGMTAEQAQGDVDAEWVVHGPAVNAEWKRLRGLKVSKPKVGATGLSPPSPTTTVSSSALPKQLQETIVLYFHGGAYFMGSPATTRNLTTLFSEHSGCRVLSVGYRLAPENPYPIPLFDAISAYLALIDPPAGSGMPRYKPEQIVFAGDSAGGGLAIALAIWIRDNGGTKWKKPAGIVALAPWLDLTHSQPSFHLNTLDYIPPTVADPSHITPRRSHYYTTDDAQNSHPYVSPLFASDTPLDPSTHLPPTLIQLGSRERLRDEGLMFAADSFSGSPVRVEVYQDMVHIFQAFAARGEEIAVKALSRVGEFIRNVASTATAGEVEAEGEEEGVVSHPTRKGFLYVSEGSVTEIGRDGALEIVEEAREQLLSQSLEKEREKSGRGSLSEVEEKIQREMEF